MVRKSLEDWHGKSRPDRVAARSPESRAVVDALLASAGIDVTAEDESVPVEVTAIEYDVWIAVGAARADLATYEGDKPLVDEFGSEAAARDAFEIWASVEERLKRAARKAGRPARPEPPPPDTKSDRELLARIARIRQRPSRMSTADILRFSTRRAIELGFQPGAIWTKEQGRRKSEELKDARAQIVLELREQNATLPDIGAVFGGRTKESVYALVQRAKTNRTNKRGDEHG